MPGQLSTEQKDKIIKNAFERLQTYQADGRGLAEYSVDVMYWLKKQPEVAEATLRGRSTLTVEFEDGTQVGILLDSLNRYGGSDDVRFDPSVTASFAGNRRLFPITWPWKRKVRTPGTKKALLFDPLYDDWPPESTTDGIEQALQDAGYTVDKMLGSNGDLAHLETIENARYGVIFMRTHGGLLVVNGDDKIHIMTRPFFDTLPNPANSGYTGIGVFLVNTNWGPKYAYAFNEQFVRNHLAAARFPDTVMHLLVCFGGAPEGSDDLIDAFLDFSVGCYTGWTRTASSAHGDPAAVAFFEYLCGAYGRTIAGAINHIESLGHSPDSQTSAELVAYGNGKLCLIGLPKIVITLAKEHLQLIRELPKEHIELVVEMDPEVHLPDWTVVGGKLAPVDRLGRRRFIPNSNWPRILGIGDRMEDAVEEFVS